MSKLAQPHRHGAGRRAVSVLRAIALAAVLTLISLSPTPAEAVKIQKVVSPGGIEAWLVEHHSVPLVAMRFAFLGGSAQDGDDREGLSYFLSGMLDEGAGDLTSVQFQEKLEDIAAKISFDAARDTFYGSFQTLTRNLDPAADLLRLALTKPTFEEDAVERIRKQILAGLEFDKNEPRKVASKAWYKIAFGDHPYGRTIRGRSDTVKAITSADLKGFAGRILARDNLKVAVVGDIDAARLGALLDKVFSGLPAKADLKPVPEAVTVTGPQRQVIEMDITQSVAVFGHRGVKRKDKDFVAFYVLNYIIGGGGFSSRFMEEVREKRGLAYSVYSYLSPYRYGALYLGSVATKNKSLGRSLEVIRSELERMAEQGPDAEELKNAKEYLTGSYPLRFDTSTKIAGQLLGIQIEDLGIDYVVRRNSMIEALTLDDIRRVARKLFHAEGLIVAIVGKPGES